MVHAQLLEFSLPILFLVPSVILFMLFEADFLISHLRRREDESVSLPSKMVQSVCIYKNILHG